MNKKYLLLIPLVIEVYLNKIILFSGDSVLVSQVIGKMAVPFVVGGILALIIKLGTRDKNRPFWWLFWTALILSLLNIITSQV